MDSDLKPTLAVMAAGLGQRYGGLKQIEPVDGHILLEYAIYDALKVGFGRIVILIRKDFEKEFIEKYGKRITRAAKKFDVDIDYVYQESLLEIKENFPFREKIWGTGYAVLCFKAVVKEPFAIINADDFYGRESFRALYKFFNRNYNPNGNIHSLVGFLLKNVVSNYGPFARAVCEISNGFLDSIVEREEIILEGDKIMYKDENRKHFLDKNSIVSTNLWGFNPTIFADLENGFKEFLKDIKEKRKPRKEYYIPDFIFKSLSNNKIKVKVLLTEERCFGLTYKKEYPIVAETIKKLKDEGLYPKRLW